MITYGLGTPVVVDDSERDHDLECSECLDTIAHGEAVVRDEFGVLCLPCSAIVHATEEA